MADQLKRAFCCLWSKRKCRVSVSEIVAYQDEVRQILASWTPEALKRLPDYPPRDDLDLRAKVAWYRGHAESSWTLRPAVFRLDGYTVQREIDMNMDYRRRVSFLPDMPPPDDLGAWLSRMQHYRLPTRLLDWTESPLVALYFALEECASYARWNRLERFTPVVWMINPYVLNWVSTEHAGSVVPSTDLHEQWGSTDENLTPAFGCSNIFPAFGARSKFTREYPGPMAVMPHAIDRRMHAQRARFTVHGSVKSSIEVMFRRREQEDLEAIGFLSRIPVSTARKDAESMLAALSSVSVSRSVLFPDAEGVAIDTASRF